MKNFRRLGVLAVGVHLYVGSGSELHVHKKILKVRVVK